MKKIISLLVLIIATTTIFADNIPTLVVNTQNAQTEFTISDIRKIVFDNSENMVIVAKDATETSYAIATISNMTFLNVSSDIEDVEVLVDDAPVKKFIQDGKLFILRDGVIYNAVGSKVKTL